MEVLQSQIEQDPELLQRIQQYEEELRYRVSNIRSQEVITIPVVFHIVHNGQAIGTGPNISEALILAQLEQMNLDFAAANPDKMNIPALFQSLHGNTMIQFCLAQRDPDGNPTTGINRIHGGQSSWFSFQIEATLKPATIWNRDEYLNIWTVNFHFLENILGYAQFPGGPADKDGIVSAYYSIGSIENPNPAGGNYGYGRTTVHEVGHWLNLLHIWGSGNTMCGNDFVADTPVHRSSNFGCPTHPKTNNCAGGPHTEMFMNYMDYTDDQCMIMFSIGQGQRMMAELISGGRRVSLSGSMGCLPPNHCSENPLYLSQKPIESGLYQSTHFITSTGEVEPFTQVEFRSEVSITLTAGFHAKEGSEFNAEIGECIFSNTMKESTTIEIKQVATNSESFRERPVHEARFSIYPNPSSQFARIDYHLDVAMEVEMALFNLSGQMVTVLLPLSITDSGSHHFILDTGGLHPGIWIVRMRAGQEVLTKKVVVVH
ncbi:MAG TPA: M43 family zinc metalloprotease [Saprospiraceae bacterium]|nr:M43 family zinc metalloprotease [Saprospiraceae bacterium]